MPDCANSIPIPQTQEALERVVADLRLPDEGFLALAQGKVLDSTVPAAPRAGVECVRTDLLDDWIRTLSVLAKPTGNTAFERRAEITVAVHHLGGFTAELIAI